MSVHHHDLAIVLLYYSLSLPSPAKYCVSVDPDWVLSLMSRISDYPPQIVENLLVELVSSRARVIVVVQFQDSVSSLPDYYS